MNTPKECPELDDGLSGVSGEADYGYTTDNPVRVGGGSKNELKYLHMLLSSEKDFVDQFFPVGNSWGKGVSVSGYKSVIKGDTLDKIIYLDTRNCRDPMAPQGFSIKEDYREIK